MTFKRNVFINCPFDNHYSTLLRPMVFTLLYLGMNPRLVLENRDCSESRLHKIQKIMKESKYSIHDISCIRAKKSGEYFRMNMPFEMGIDYGFKTVSKEKKLKSKQFLVLESKKYQSKKGCSDISGWDPEAHNDKPMKIIKIVSDWITDTCSVERKPFTEIWNMYNDSYKYIDDHLYRKKKRISLDDMSINEYKDKIKKWIETQASA